MMRSSALSLAFGYVALGIAALVLFAAPLWYEWQVTIQESRVEILQADAQRLTDVFRRDGADGLRSFIDARVGMQIVGQRAAAHPGPTELRRRGLPDRDGARRNQPRHHGRVLSSVMRAPERWPAPAPRR